ncbi:YfbK domain-containing protein [Flavobacterium alkalisoli]|uniref:YfbK domain-containing protein n=1 Tax=Flavobacterium alkalisoli TaxID=2602769 RepID=UPI003A8E1E27
MENQDKLYEQFKDAAGKAEEKGFDRMEAVWNRVEDKLDRKKKRRGAIYWRYGGVAAALLILLALGGRFFNNHTSPELPEQNPETQVTTIDHDKIEETFSPTAKDSEKIEVVIGKENTTTYTSETDSIKFESITQKARVWNSKSSEDEFWIKGNVTEEVKFKPLDARKKEVVAESTQLDEVVVTSYRSVTSHKSAMAVATIQAESLEDRANTVPIQSLQGKVSGVKINEQPGVDKTIMLRGAGSISSNVEPLYVVDGLPVDEKTFRNLNQNDITSIAVYKDAVATSIYGNRGANGVVVISTINPGVLTPNVSNGTYDISDGSDTTYRNLPGQILGVQEDADKSIDITSLTTFRGYNPPLYVIDGMPVDEETAKTINANDIASVTILKNASATSLYGARGANGVVILTTKTGTSDIEISDELDNEQPDPFKIHIDKEEYEMFEENKFENPAVTPLSTFSIDVDNASYTNVRRFLNNGQTVPKDAVRVEEMINFFKYSYPQPKGDMPFSINTEYSDAPWNPKHKLLKIGLKGLEIPTEDLPASNFVFLIDVSGSMDSENKLPLLKQSMKLLVNQMRPKDRIAIVVYAGAAGLVLPSTSGSEKTKIVKALDELNAGGSTAGGEGIELAYKTAQEHFIKGGNNRVILATDGDFNVGASSNRDMQTLIEEKRKNGVFLTCLGYGMGNYKDSKMETLADKGNGNYAYIDNMQEADRFLQKEFKGSMYAIAKDVKIQIEFNPKHVQSYRLIGYENRKLRNEDFANDAIDAGELGSGHTVTALYEIIPTGVQSDYFNPAPELKYSQPTASKNKYSDELATIKFRHKKPDGDKSKETVQVIPNKAVSLEQASGDFKFAAAVAWFGLKLRDSKLIPNKASKDIIKLAKEGSKPDPDGYKAEFIRLVDMVQ